MKFQPVCNPSISEIISRIFLHPHIAYSPHPIISLSTTPFPFRTPNFPFLYQPQFLIPLVHTSPYSCTNSVLALLVRPRALYVRNLWNILCLSADKLHKDANSASFRRK